MMHPGLADLFERLTKAGIRWCLLRMPSRPEAPTGDIDLLLDDKTMSHWQWLLDELGFVRYPAAVRDGERVYPAYHAATGQWLWLHILTRLSFGSGRTLVTDAADACLERRQQREDGFILADEDLFWTSLLHVLLEKSSISEYRRTCLQDLLPCLRFEGPLLSVVETACPIGWSAARIADCVRRQEWTALEDLRPVLIDSWRRRQPLRRRLFLTWGRLIRLVRGASARLRRRGLSVALLGPDGAGKTTLAEGVQQQFCTPVRSIYMGSGAGMGQGALVRWRIPGLGSPGRLLTLWLRYLHSLWHKSLGRLVIFDRYIHDAGLPQGERMPWSYRLTRWLHAHACPSPDLVLVLDAPAEMMYRRKGEQDPVALEKQRQHFLSLSQRYPRVEVVDASRDPLAVRS
ncbi:MAG: hypothetical protein ACRELF_18390, partial [Gemmataceae bacterium]